MTNLLYGLLITSVLQVGEIIDHVNAIAFMPQDSAQVTEYLDEIHNRATPVIIINSFYQDSTGIRYRQAWELNRAIKASGSYGRMVFMWDEPLMHGTRAGQSRDEVLEVMRRVKLDFPRVEFVHIESFTDLYDQWTTTGQLKLFYDADHIGFDCYGNFDGCGGFGVPEVPQYDYISTMWSEIQRNKSKAKIFMVPGAFVNELYMTDQQQVIKQLQDYAMYWYDTRDNVSGLGIFTWGDVIVPGDESTGARNLPAIRDYTINGVLNFVKKHAN